MLTNAIMIRDSLSSIGLEINNSKCEVLLINHTDINKPQTSKLFQDQFSSLAIPDPTHWQLLGSPLHQESAPLHLKAKIKVLDSITENLELIEPHQAFYILQNCLSIPKLTYLLHSAPCFKCKEELEAFDNAKRTNTEKISNVTFGKDSWSQASLPIWHGGLGLRSAADLSLSFFLSSSFACQGLVNKLLPSLTLPHGVVINATDAWSALHDSSPRQKETQSAWDDLACETHSLPCSTPQALGTTAGYSLHRKATPLTGQKPSQLPASETCWAPNRNCPANWCQYFRKHRMPLQKVCWQAGASWPLLH